MRKIGLMIRLNEDEHAELKRRSGQLRMAEYLRRCAIYTTPIQIPACNGDAIRQLNRIGVNLNQLTKLAHVKKGAQLEKLFDQVFVETMMLGGVLNEIEDDFVEQLDKNGL